MDCELAEHPELNSWVAEDPRRAIVALHIGRHVLDNAERDQELAGTLREQLSPLETRLRDAQRESTSVIETRMRDLEARLRDDQRDDSALLSAITRLESQSLLSAQTQLMVGSSDARILARLDEFMNTIKSTATTTNGGSGGYPQGAGEIGEKFVLGVAQRVWPKCEIRDTSGVSHMSDLQVLTPHGTCVIEVKNKAIVTLDDVRKAERDLVELNGDSTLSLRAYVFVSLRSPAIPHKSGYEVIAPSATNGITRPVLVAWLGFDAASHALLAQHLAIVDAVMAMLVAEDERAIDADAASAKFEEAEALISSCTAQLGRLAAQKKAVDSMRESLKSMHASWKQLEASTVESYDAFRALLDPILAEGLLTCPKCAKIYKMRKAFDLHVSKCQ